MQSIRPAQRFLSWVVIVLLLPVFTIAFIRAMVRKESNRVNAFTLSVYTAVDALRAYLLLGAALTGWFSVLLFIIAVGAALAYNFYIMNFALRLEV
jgi:FtsH-binding integral membrane protein